MRFGPVPLAEAAGAILAHSVAVPRGRLRKGLCLSPSDVAQLEQAGLAQVIVARLDPSDVQEDDAAARLAAALLGRAGSKPVPDRVPGLVPVSGPGPLRAGVAVTGRVNLYAEGPGLLAVDPARVTALNEVNPLITLATLPPLQRVQAGDMVATVKIISYAVPEPDLIRVEALAAGALGFHPPVLRSACLIETAVPGQDLSPKGRAAIRARLDRLGVALSPRRVIVPHAVAPLAEAASAALEGTEGGEGVDLVLILTGSATSDPDDVMPAAVRAAGGTVSRFGMPVDPGNLLCLGDVGGRPVVGLPGCARSPALNGADWVLERLVCAIAVDGSAIAAMGVGGLLKEPVSRPRPRRAAMD